MQISEGKQMTALSRELRSFLEIAGERSLRGAAEKLNLSPSALSRQIQILERDFGVPLLVRLPQGIELTAEGNSLLRLADGWRKDEADLRGAIGRIAERPGLTLRLGLMECLAQSALPLPEDPGVRLEVVVAGTGPLTEMLFHNELDAIVAFNVPRVAQLRILWEQDCVLGLVHGNGISPPPGPAVRLQDCLQWPLCLPDQSLSMHPRLTAEIFRSRIDPVIALRSNSIALLRRFVAMDRGVSFLTWYDVSEEVGQGLLNFVPLENKRLKETLYICTASRKRPDPGVARALTALGRQLSGIGEKMRRRQKPDSPTAPPRPAGR